MRDRDEYSADLDKQDVTGRPLTRREQKQQEKFEKQAEAIRASALNLYIVQSLCLLDFLPLGKDGQEVKRHG